jgi:hypothetical protein
MIAYPRTISPARTAPSLYSLLGCVELRRLGISSRPMVVGAKHRIDSERRFKPGERTTASVVES